MTNEAVNYLLSRHPELESTEIRTKQSVKQLYYAAVNLNVPICVSI
jgi:hypothetical protein